MKPSSETDPSLDSALQRLATAVMTARTERQMSRAALAEQAGTSLQLVADLERGYPVPRRVVSAICRNLDLAEPPSESSPLIRLALLVRQRRGQARLSRAQLAQRAGLTSPIIRGIETATLQPTHQLCMALLTVKALQLHEMDVAAFLAPPAEHVGSGASRSTETPPSLPAATVAPEECAETTGFPPHSASSGNAGPIRTSHCSLDNQVVATFLVRFFANGKVSLEMRPTLAKSRRAATPEETPRGSNISPRSS